MARQPKHFLKFRPNRSTNWVSVDEGGPEILDKCRERAAACQPAEEVAVFLGGKIISWWRGGQDVSDTSRQHNAPAPIDDPDAEFFTHHFVSTSNHVVASCVARDENMAWRMANSALPHWDIDALKIDKLGKTQGPCRWSFIDPAHAPIREGETP